MSKTPKCQFRTPFEKSLIVKLIDDAGRVLSSAWADVHRDDAEGVAALDQAEQELTAIEQHTSILYRYGWTISDVVSMEDRIWGERGNTAPLYVELRRICAKVRHELRIQQREARAEQHAKSRDAEIALLMSMNAVEQRARLSGLSTHTPQQERVTEALGFVS